MRKRWRLMQTSFRLPDLTVRCSYYRFGPSFLFLARLRDESCQVRKNTLMVLTHLILNDMVKVKGQISEMATCLEDKDARIADLSKLFFLELSKKVSVDLLPFRIYVSAGDCFKD